MSVVDPSDFIPQLVIWSTFNIFATCGLVALFIVTLLVYGMKANWTLVNLEIIFILSSSTTSALIWTGHARDLHPPFELCLMNASATMANVPLMAGAALSIVAKVWGTAMGIWHPRVRPVLEWIIWTPILVLLPFIFAVPLFVAGIALGVRDRTKVFRGSPFYCLLGQDSLQTMASVLGAVLTLISLILASWTAIDGFVTWRRVGGRRIIENPLISYAFILRVILFSVFVGAAFVSGIIALSSSFDAVIPDIIVASCGVGAFFIFASAPHIVRFVFCCKRETTRSFTIQTSAWTGMPSWRSGRGTHSEPPQEFDLSKIREDKIQAPDLG
ncbi:hypothetical protein B0H17DRAFT_1198146 [Mycena rosella]|uniref:Uncharacterized protein n=1 Tax=Mycena rosella TaxID=1033263 RepID=A0AAD7GMK8_MYCRO|nr:hypothetical protein B0H17DRAFT_1198146 [Mycena rosella]